MAFKLIIFILACVACYALELEELLNVTTSLSVGEETEAQERASEVSLESALKEFDGKAQTLDTIDDQTRLDTLIRALRRLPDEELAMYGLSPKELEEHVSPDSREAVALFAAWQERQNELKKAIESMMKPAEYMQELVEFIVGSPEVTPGSDKFSSKMDALRQLESLVEDIDNARDFHTTGGFAKMSTSLFSGIEDKYTMEERGMIALTLGNAVKNDYDFQLWVLEDDAICLHGLLDMLGSGDSDDLVRRRALYALSSAARGNSDVQEYLLNTTSHTEQGDGVRTTSRIVVILQELTEAYITGTAIEEDILTSTPSTPSLELVRKIYAFVSDMLHEHNYLQEQIRNPQKLDLGDLQIDVGNGEGEVSESALAGQLMAQLHTIRLLGVCFCVRPF